MATQFLTFSVGDEVFATAAADVSEVVRRPRLTRVPKGPASLLGVTSFRGSPTPVLSLARLLGREDASGDQARLLVLEGATPLGLMVDRVGALSDLAQGASGADSARPGFGRFYAVDGSAVRVLDLEALIHRDFAGLARAPRQSARPTSAPSPQARQIAETVLLGFDLAGQSYAFDLAEVDEVLNLPPDLAAPAQSDEALLGVIALRDQLLPIVSLRRLLGLPDEAVGDQRVIVVRIGAARVGLAVDRLRAISRISPDAVDAAPAVLNRGVGEAQVGSIARLPGGLAAVLSGERLFREEKVAHILADGQSVNGDSTMAAADAGEHVRFLIFRLGDEEYGLPLSAVDEVVRKPEQLTRLPKSPPFIEGVLNHRGQIIPVIDQRSRFEVSHAGAAGRARIIVAVVDGRQAGFIVDAVAEILNLSADEIGETPQLAADAGRLFSQVASLDEGRRLILLVEPKELLDRAERDLLAAFEAGAAGA